MIKTCLLFFIITYLFYSITYAAGTSTSNDKGAKGAWKDGKSDKSYMIGKNSNLKRGVDALKQAKKYDKKGKKDKAKKRFNDAINFFILANEENPNEPYILSYLGYSFTRAGDYMMAEIYYEQGLAIDPLHIGINEYLGELYVETNRIEKAKERLMVLKNCNCEEYDELQNLISKY